MAIVLPQRHKAQPQYAANVDYKGLGRGVKLLVHPPIGYADLLTGRNWTPNGNTKIITSQLGRAYSFDGNNSSMNIVGYPELAGIGTFFAFFSRVGASDPFGHGYLSSTSPNAKYFLVSSAGKIWAGTPYGSNEAISSWFNTANRSLVLVEGPGPTEVKAYVDGRDAGLTWSSSGSATWGAGNKTIEIGGDGSSANWDANCDLLVLGWTSAAWGEGEAKAFHDSRGLALFTAPARRIWIAPAAGPDGSITGAGQIASAEALGSPSLQAGITATGISSTEAIGSAGIATAVAAVGIASTEASGTPAVASTVSASGIASAGALGTAALVVDVVSAGVASSEAVGSPAVSSVAPAEVIGTGAIASAEALGLAAVDLSIAAAGVQSSEATGSADLAVQVAAAGIATAEAVGLPEVGGIAPAEVAGAGKIASSEAAGTPAVAGTISAIGAESSVAFGTGSLSVAVEAAGIASTAAVGVPTVGEVPDQEITGAGAIASTEAIGSPAIHGLVPYTGTGFHIGSGHRPLRPRRREQPLQISLPHRIGVAGIQSSERMGYPALKWRGRSRKIRDEELLLGRVA